MGVGGWDVIEWTKKLVGEAVEHDYQNNVVTGDNDWNLIVKPAPGYEHIAAGNEDGNVECEIRTAIDSNSTANAQFGELMHRTVTVWGVWTKDVSHDHKKEIHPLELLLCDFGYVSTFTKLAKVMVMSDHSPNFMIIPPRPHLPGAKANVHARFSFDFPPTPHDDCPPAWSYQSEKNLADGRSYWVTGDRGRFLLHGQVASGTGDNHGYYRAHLRLGCDTSREPSYIGLLRPGTMAEYYALGFDPGSFFSIVKGKFGEGLPLRRMRTYVRNGHRLWAGTFDQTNRGAYMQWYMSWNDFATRYRALQKSMNLVDVETHIDEGGARHWTAAWEEKTGDDGFVLGDIQTVARMQEKWSLPLVILKSYVDSGTRKWIGVFRETGVPTEVLVALSWNDLLNLHNDPNRAIAQIEPYMEGGRRLWAAIVQRRPNDVTLTWWPNVSQFGHEVQRLIDYYGLRLSDFAVCRGWR